MCILVAHFFFVGMERGSNDADSPVSGGGAPETRLHTVFPRLPIFSGDTKDTALDLWRYED